MPFLTKYTRGNDMASYEQLELFDASPYVVIPQHPVNRILHLVLVKSQPQRGLDNIQLKLDLFPIVVEQEPDENEDLRWAA